MKKSLTLLLSMLLLSFHALSQEWISVNSGKPESSLFGVNTATSGGSRIQVSLPDSTERESALRNNSAES